MGVIRGDLRTEEGLAAFRQALCDAGEERLSFVRLDTSLPPFEFAMERKLPVSALRLGAALHEYFQGHMASLLPAHELRSRVTLMN